MFRIRTRNRAAVRTARATAAAGLALAALTGVAPASADALSVGSGPVDSAPEGRDGRPARPATVSGSARIWYAFSPDDEIWFTVDARAKPYSRPLPGTKAPNGLPTDAVGTVRYSHRVGATGEVYSAEAEVDCLSTGGPVATLTAVIDTEGHKERIGLSIYQGSGRDAARLGFSWGVANLDMDADQKPYQPVVGTCMAPAPFAPVLRGGFAVHHVELEAPKTPGQ
ncbi:hypothetical protein ADK60_15895 [Streptomyces sp. XY431]|uniref:hypothetical protein n=1 Tax=Streptomyces sp. XY431 TaxID=1415562 RepID=UPI0006AFE2D0|nr:hypothetical protein [Streptomyces sp. XY431]KOV30931.1 hypothetical protein ADK60_15895 [Streptomyces sp. XY431]